MKIRLGQYEQESQKQSSFQKSKTCGKVAIRSTVTQKALDMVKTGFFQACRVAQSGIARDMV